MGTPTDPIVFFEDLTPEQEEALRAALKADQALAAAFGRWRRLRGGVRRRLADALPDRRLLVCFALDVAGRAGDLEPAERDALEAARPSLQRALSEHPALHDVVREVTAAAADFDDAWYRFEPPDARPDRPADIPRRSPAKRFLWRGAMLVALAGFAAVAILILQRDQNLIDIRTGENEVQHIELADGTTVRLLGASVLTYADPAAATRFKRYARLVGQAFFEITAGRETFSIETPTARMTALGTSFGVQAGEDVTEVVLATGRLAFASRTAPTRPVVLEPGETSRVAASALPSTPAPVDVSEALAWTGLFIFEGEPVEEAARKLSRHYGTAIDIAPPLSAEVITGRFEQSQPLAEILDVVAAALDAEVDASAAGFRLQPRR